jgi:hypothetical protein
VLIALALAGCGGSGSNSKTTTPPPPPPPPPPTQDTLDPSVSRQWNEVMLDAIRNDFARPTIHARNLFHASAAAYDAWAVYDDTASSYLLGNSIGGFTCDLAGNVAPADVHPAREEAISYAIYRLISHRFANSPGVDDTMAAADALMLAQGFGLVHASQSVCRAGITGQPEYR